MRSREFITELFNQPYPVKIFQDQAVARDSKRRPLYVVFDRRPAWETVKITFDRGQDFALTGLRDEYRIMATVVSAIQQWAAKYQPGSMYFSVPEDEPTNRMRLYDRMVASLVQGSGYSLMSDPDRVDDEAISYYMARIGKRFGDDRFWWLVRDDLIKPAAGRSGKFDPGGPGGIEIDENFADGRKPGRKGLSRRVGIPKKATLGQLEKIAKSSTGERRKMAQWQLNMRRGRTRKNK